MADTRPSAHWRLAIVGFVAGIITVLLILFATR
jgi:hypothetical protein